MHSPVVLVLLLILIMSTLVNAGQAHTDSRLLNTLASFYDVTSYE